MTIDLQLLVGDQKLTHLFMLSETTGSGMLSMEKRICEDLAGSQQFMFELVRSQQTVSESVKNIAGQLAGLSAAHISQLISTRFDPLNDNISSHNTDLREEIARIKLGTSNPMLRNIFEVAVNSAIKSHLKTVPYEQSKPQRAMWPT
jgi:hypothetical protein